MQGDPLVWLADHLHSLTWRGTSVQDALLALADRMDSPDSEGDWTAVAATIRTLAATPLGCLAGLVVASDYSVATTPTKARAWVTQWAGLTVDQHAQLVAAVSDPPALEALLRSMANTRT